MVGRAAPDRIDDRREAVGRHDTAHVDVARIVDRDGELGAGFHVIGAEAA
jgi:hypothetical protein